MMINAITDLTSSNLAGTVATRAPPNNCLRSVMALKVYD